MHPTADTTAVINFRRAARRVIGGVMRLAHMFRRKNIVEDVTAAELRRMLKACPACGGDLAGHKYANFAITIATDENHPRLVEFFEALKGHRWRGAKGFQEFDGRYNAAEAIALRCVSGSLIMLLIRNPEELWESSGVLDYEALSPEGGKELDAQIEPDKWRAV
jgi:hypothetical protein